MVVVIFRSRLRAETIDEFRPWAKRMMELAHAMPGFISSQDYESAGGDRCSIIEFASQEHLAAWRNHPEHQEAQRLGREYFFEEYSLHVGETVRESHFKA
ncbi:MAG: antibiotic biosynthesis monooxygenase [Myxococcota bacterium]|nr:antibiotic biosynthesis monooxygenase [Myxococcota bacterium]